MRERVCEGERERAREGPLEEKTQQGTAITNRRTKPGGYWIVSDSEAVRDPAGETTAVSSELFGLDLMQRAKRSRMTTEAMRISHM